jgi:SAM-dependent methyltransferase
VTTAKCRSCGAPLSRTFVDLGLSPLSNSFVPRERLDRSEVFYPLHAFVCDRCLLVQLEEFETPTEIFSDYAYFSSHSTTWLAHSAAYTRLMIERFALGRDSKVVEIASNDGYLLQYFRDAAVPVLGVEPAANVAKAAIARGIPTEIAFFGKSTAERLCDGGHAADLMAANNVLAHVPDILDFVAGFAVLLKPEGVATFEFPHLVRLIEGKQFDTIYHEHFSYLSLHVVMDIFRRNGLRVFDVERLPTHGGSLRVFACRSDATHEDRPAVREVIAEESDRGLLSIAGYAGFAGSIAEIKLCALEFLIEARRQGKRVCAYGAAAKGNTFINYCGIRPDLVSVVADKSPQKQTTYMPGSRIPVVAPETMLAMKPDYVLILAWNLREEIVGELADIRSWGGRFVTAIPEVHVF